MKRANWRIFFKICLYIHIFGDFRCAPVLVVLRVLDVLTVLLGFLRARRTPRTRSCWCIKTRLTTPASCDAVLAAAKIMAQW